MKVILLFAGIFSLFLSCFTNSQSSLHTQVSQGNLHPFGTGGQIKMLYDRRQRPPAIFLNNQVHIVYNAGREESNKKKPQTKPLVLTYDLLDRDFSREVVLGPADGDHHYGPVIWGDTEDHLHVLYGCHRTPGTHLISSLPRRVGESLKDWQKGPEIAPGISYPSIYCISDNRQLIYYRTAGHISSWTYRISADNGHTWSGPEEAVTDMDSKGRFEWSSYHTVLPSKDGKSLHVAFMAYDDNRSKEPDRYFNPRYQQTVSNEWKYNLYYLRIDLETQEVFNFEGERMQTPIDIEQADARCRIWDTGWRGAGVPPSILLDANEEPAFLHVLSGETLKQHHYYYVHRTNHTWQQSPITTSNHQWNSCHLSRDREGRLHAYLIVGKGYLDTDNYYDKHGGGKIEEWISTDEGNSWQLKRELTPDHSAYPDWRFNNVQPVTTCDGSVVEDLLLFYGWKGEEAWAFLVDERARP